MSHSLRKTTCGIPALDDILHGGLWRERLYLIDGNPGSGKTTLALQFLRWPARAGRALPVRHAVRDARRNCVDGAASHDWSLDGIDIVELASDDDGAWRGAAR